MKQLKSSLLFCLVLLYTSTFAQLTSVQIDSLVQKAMGKFNVAGVAVAIVKDGKIIHEKGYGVRSIQTKLPVDEHTNFQIASNSKAFTAAALAILIDEKKINWKDKVKTYLPEFKLYNEYVTDNFLVEDLLCHRSGLGLGAGDLMDWPDGTDFTIQDRLTAFQHFKPQSDFRTKYDYNNQLYLIAGELIARVSDMTWEKFVQSRILDPLQMTQSFSSQAVIKDKNNMATPHSTESGAIKTIAASPDMVNGAAAGIVSNVDDMCKWMITQLNKGHYGTNLEKQLFSEARQKEMWTLHTVAEHSNNTRYNQHFGGYGLGWELADIKGNLQVSHTGGLSGMLTCVTMIPDLNLGIVILTNTHWDGSGLFRSLQKTILDSYLGLGDNGWTDTYYNRLQTRTHISDSVVAGVWKTVEAIKKTKINVEDYVGIYEDKWFGKVEIFLKGGQLWFKSSRSPKLNGPMFFYKTNTFAIKWEYQDMNCDAFAAFSMNKDGKAMNIKMNGISPGIDFSFDFQDLDLQKVKN